MNTEVSKGDHAPVFSDDGIIKYEKNKITTISIQE
jgi:hypothetical protein